MPTLLIADDHPLFREALKGAVQRVIPGVQLLEADSVEALYTLAEQHPDADLFFISGADAIAQILTWKDAAELWSLAHFIAVSRPGHDLSVRGLPEGDVSLLEIPALAISSTDCRERVENGSPVWYLVPDGVVQYISKHQLYRSTTS